MPKMRTCNAAAKRFKTTATGKVQRAQTRQNHLMTCKSSKKKRALSGEKTLGTKDVRKVKRLLGQA